MHPSISFGAFVRRHRKARGLTQAELAQHAHCSRATIRKLESDERRPSPELVASLAHALALNDDERATLRQLAWRPLRSEPPVFANDLFVSAHMPPRRSHLLGRDALCATIRRDVCSPQVRLLTLHGPGGVGKTQLALHVAAALGDDPLFADGVFVVGLAAVSDASRAAVAIGQALGVRETATQTAFDLLIEALSGKAALLVLDNLEQIDDAAALVAALLEAAPRLTVLATTRVLLRLSAEHALAVPPLALPSAGDAIAATPAVALFAERARAVAPSFALTARNAQAVATICARADGLPLAIELLAARCRLLSPPALLSRLEGAAGHTPLHLTQSRDPALPDRHRGLHAVLDWSYGLLTPSAQRLFRRLAVFVDGCTLAAVHEVCDPHRESFETNVEVLIDSSLLVQDDRSDDSRVAMLEMVRAYARERLAESGEEHHLRGQHADWYLALAERAEPQLTGADQGRWLDRLERDHDNLRAALSWSLATGAVERAARIAGAIFRYWWISGQYTEGRSWLEHVLSAATDLAPLIRAKALSGAGAIATTQTDYPAARAFHEEALTIRRAMGDARGVAGSLGNLGNVARQMDDKASARRYYTESMAIFRELGNTWGVATSLLNLGTLLSEPHELDEKQSVYAESLVLYRELGDQHGMLLALGNLGEAALLRGDYATATARYREVLDQRRLLHNPEGVASCLMMLGIVAIAEGKVDRGVWLLGSYEALRVTIAVGIASAYRADYEAYVARARAALSEARFAALWQAGRDADLDVAITIALADTLPE